MRTNMYKEVVNNALVIYSSRGKDSYIIFPPKIQTQNKTKARNLSIGNRCPHHFIKFLDGQMNRQIRANLKHTSLKWGHKKQIRSYLLTYFNNIIMTQKLNSIQYLRWKRKWKNHYELDDLKHDQIVQTSNTCTKINTFQNFK